MLVRPGCRVGPDRVDRHDVRALLSGFEHEPPLVYVRRQGVHPPEQDQASTAHLLGVEADDPRGRRQRLLGCGVADRRREAGCTEAGEQPRPHRPALDPTHRARVVVREHGLGAESLARASNALCDRTDRVVPADPLEPSFALLADPAHREEQSLGIVERIQIVIDLATQRAPRERVLSIASQVYRTPVLDRDEPRAGVRAVEGARASNRRSHGANLAGRRD